MAKNKKQVKDKKPKKGKKLSKESHTKLKKHFKGKGKEGKFTEIFGAEPTGTRHENAEKVRGYYETV